MRLNQSHKQMVISAIMEDVPKVDYSRKFRELVNGYWNAYALPAVKAMVEREQTDQLNRQFWPAIGLDSVCTFGKVELPAVAQAAYKSSVAALTEKKAEQDKSRRELKAKISATVNSCSTLKQLKERLPEFEKYFPKDQPAPTPNLPVANLIADLQAAGWPKDQKK